MTDTFLVDAYNLLFWCLEGTNLEKERTQLIHEVNFHAKRRGLDVTLIFDATWTEDPLARGHYDALQIIFTAKGVTADDHILTMLEGHRKIIVVTSDKDLARRSRHLGAKTVSTPSFYSWIKKPKFKAKQKTEKSITEKIDFPPPKVVVQEGSILWYQRQFESRMQQELEKRKQEKKG